MIGNGGRLALVSLFVAAGAFGIGCSGPGIIEDDIVADEEVGPKQPRSTDAGVTKKPTNSPLPVPTDTDAGDPMINCFGRKLDAWACEGFEEPSAPSAPLTVQISNGVVTRVTNRAVAGVASLRSTFAPIPAQGKAQVAFQKPAGAPGMALQLSVYIDDDAHDIGQDIVLARLSGGTTNVRLYFVPAANGHLLEVRTKSAAGEATHSLGPAPKNAWACIEIEADAKSDLKIWRGGEVRAAFRMEGAPTLARAEVGMEWTHGANANASKAFWFDDIVVAPKAVGCLH